MVGHSDLFNAPFRRLQRKAIDIKRYLGLTNSLEQGILLPPRIQFKPIQRFTQLRDGSPAREPIWHSCVVRQ
jgi:hypothetical protein